MMFSARDRVRLAAIPGLLAVSLGFGCASEPPPSASVSSAAPTTEVPAAAPAPPPAEAPAAPVTVADAPTPLSPEQIWQQLQQPEDTLYVVLLRHAIAPGTGDPTNFQLTDCSTQRNLSEAGREQARQIGQAFRDRGVAVKQVLSSQWCRCLETAELMDLGTVEPYPPLNSFFRDRRTAATQTTATQNFLLSQASEPGVIVMVTHQVNITGLTDIVPRSGEAVVLQVEADQLTEVGQFMPAS